MSLGVGRRRLVGVCRPDADRRTDGVARASPSNCDTGRLPPSPGHRGPAPRKIESQRGLRMDFPCHEDRGRELRRGDCPVYVALAPSRPGPSRRRSMQRGRLVSPARCAAPFARVVKRRRRYCWCPARSGPVRRLAKCSQSGGALADSSARAAVIDGSELWGYMRYCSRAGLSTKVYKDC